jgi:hypothetical protein
MGQSDNIYDKIQELLGNIPSNVSILEQQIDAEVQLEYYKYAQNITADFNPDEVLRNRDIIFQQDLTNDDKKLMLVQLANIDSIEAYRTLEKYVHCTHDQLKDWATLAMQECRLLLESKLLDESQVLISTGLGGKGLKLRYFTVLLSVNGKHYSAFEKKVVTELCTILSIIPLQIPVQGLFDELINECNQYGNFINTDYIITNVKIFPNNQIRDMIDHARLKSKTIKY